MGEILNIDHLSVAIDTPRGQVQAVRDVSFSLAQGETLAIVGESGCGKSILCKSIQRLLPSGGRITGGHIFFGNEDLTEKSERAMTRLRRSAFSMVFQDPMTALNPTMTVGSQIAEAVRLHHGRLPKAEVSRRVLELMDRVGIPEPVLRQHQYPHHFSGGQRQRLVLAMALAGEPAVLFADEPTTALDVTIQAQILDLFRKIQKDLNTATIFVTHDLGVVARIADRVAVMYAGKIVEIGAAEEIFTTHDTPIPRACCVPSRPCPGGRRLCPPCRECRPRSWIPLPGTPSPIAMIRPWPSTMRKPRPCFKLPPPTPQPPGF